MEKLFAVQDKVTWRGVIEKDLSKVFYPSVYKDLIKKQSFFEENFNWEIIDANKDNIENIFLPIYKEEIVSKTNYTLISKNIPEEILKKLEDKNSEYKIFYIKDNENKILGVILFSIKEKIFSTAFRAFRKSENKILRHGVTLDYWGEKVIRDFSCDYFPKLDVFSHGKDTHPYVGRRIGLVLYKLKVGTRPMQSIDIISKEPLEYHYYKEEYFINKKEPVLFFYKPDSEKFYSKCNLFFPKDSLNLSFVNEFNYIMSWSGINFNYFSY